MNDLSQFMSDPKHIHWVAAKHVLRYVRATITYGLRYTSSSGVLLAGYANSNWAGSVVDQKSTSGYYFIMVSAMISWSSKKQGSIAQSTTEAKYIAASDACKIVDCRYLNQATNEQIADILTKPLTTTKFVYFCDKLGMAENTSLAEREC